MKKLGLIFSSLNFSKIPVSTAKYIGFIKSTLPIFIFLLFQFLLISREIQAQTYKWNNVRMGGGGASPGIIAHPKVKGLYYARTDVGNPYRWDDATQRWIPLLNSIPINEWWKGAASALAIDPSDATGKIVYIVVGKYISAGDGDLLKSIDGGDTWTATGLIVKSQANGDQFAGERLAVDPNNGNVIIYTSRENGTHRSTTAASTGSWSQISTLNGNFVQFNPGSGTIANPTRTKGLYIGVVGSGVYKSNDGGSTWNLMVGSPINPRRSAISSIGELYVTHSTGVAKWNGTSWTDISPVSGADFCAIAVSPHDNNQVLSSIKGAHNLDMYKSSNGGSSWTKINKVRDVSENPWSPSWHFASSTYTFAWDPFTPERVWFSDWYNLWETSAINASTVTFKSRSVGHENIVTIGTLVSPPSGPNILLSGVADIGGMDHISLTTAPNDLPWGRGLTNGATSTGIGFQETNINFIVRAGKRDWNGEALGGYSSDGGITYKNFTTMPPIGGGRIAVAADNERIVWATQGGAVYYSVDRGNTWQPCSGAPQSVIAGDHIFIYTQPLIADKVNGNKFYLYKEGSVYISTNGGQSFALSASGLPSWGPYSFAKIESTPGVEGELWLSVEDNGLYKSTNSGAAFTKVSTVQKSRLFSIGKASPVTGKPAIFVYGTVNNIEGIFRSDDQGANWTQIDDSKNRIGMDPNAMGADRQIFGRVFIGTNGNGIYYGTPGISNTLPTVSLSSPANNATFTAGSNITISADATDTGGGSITKVEFFQGTTKLGEDLTSPHSFTWNAVAEGSYSITAKATDNNTGTTTSTAVTVIVNPATNTSPTVSITAPANNATFMAGTSIVITANASDADGITKVEFYEGAIKLGEDLTSPYSITWDAVTAGSYSITAMATHNNAATTTTPGVAITVNPANTLPTATITSPVNNETFIAGSNITISVNASDAAGGSITKVEFFQGTTKLGEDLTSPYSFTWNAVIAGDYSISAKATDNNTTSTTSAAVAIIVDPSTNTLPIISLTAPADNSTVKEGNNINLASEASDADGITKVEFYQGTTKLGEDLTFPYSFTWDAVAVGSYNLTAIATDSKSGTNTSAPIFIVVNSTANALPTVAITSPTENTTFNAGRDIFITADASDADGTVAKVEFYEGTNKLGESLALPYNFEWNAVAAGTYSISAQVTDNSGGVSASAPIVITVNPVDSTISTIAITAPADSATTKIASNIEIKADAFAGIKGVQKVEFFLGTIKLGEDSAEPFEFTWIPSESGTYTLTAKLTDTEGYIISSEKISVLVEKDKLNEFSKVKPRNLFSPNGDGKNDYWEIENIADHPEYQVTIFNRQGTKIYSKNPYVAWDGSMDGSRAAEGAYFYVIKNNDINVTVGTLTLIR